MHHGRMKMLVQIVAILVWSAMVSMDATDWNSFVKIVPLCEEDINFEIVLTTWHYEPVTALESYTFRSKINEQRDKSTLDADIQATCSFYSIVNCDSISELIHSRYDGFLAKLIEDEANGISWREHCPTIGTIDFGYDEHMESGQSLTQPSAHRTEKQPATASEVTTVVSGYWRAKNKYSDPGSVYPHEAWMQNTLSLHMPYLFFTDASHVDLIRSCRGALPTKIALRNMSEFKAYSTYGHDWTHPDHVPTPQLATIWLEKINLLLLASKITNTTFYAWVDAGLGTFRTNKLPSEEWSLEVLQSLPPTRLSYAQAHGTYHSFAATVMVLRREVIPIIHGLFYAEYEKCCREVRDWHCGSEQYILSNVRDQNPHLFHAMAYEYGDMSNLWANRYTLSKSKA
jgi:hypothetical protein